MDERPATTDHHPHPQLDKVEEDSSSSSSSKSKGDAAAAAAKPKLLFTSSPSLNDIALLSAAVATGTSDSLSPYSSLSTLNSNSNSLTPVMNKKSAGAAGGMKDDASPVYYSNTSYQQSSNANSSSNSSPINERVASLASSIYTELEKIVKAFGRDTVKDLMPIVVNVLEALNSAYNDKEEQLVENELLKDDYEKLLNQYEREKQSRKDTELKLFQSEDSFAEQKKEYEEKVKSLESIVRMIDLKSKNTSDHVMRLEEKESELKREYTKLHERYTELFKTHCDYMERTKILFGNDNRLDGSLNASNSNNVNSARQRSSQMLSKANGTGDGANKQLIELLRSSSATINRTELLNALKGSTRAEINQAISSLLSSSNTSASLSSSDATSTAESANTSSATLTANASSASLSSLASQKQSKPSRSPNSESEEAAKTTSTDVAANTGPVFSTDNYDSASEANKALTLQISENFDEHISPNDVEFDDASSDVQSSQKTGCDLEAECEEDDNMMKNGLSLFNELSRENYDITELDDGADLTGMTREVANLIRENSELLQTKHALNVLKDDLIIRLDQFSNEMVILREEIKSLQTVKASLQKRINELEDEARKHREEMSKRAEKAEEEEENVPMSQRKRFTRAEMARVLMERSQYKEKLMDLQEAVRWTEMMRASKADPNVPFNARAHATLHSQLGAPGSSAVAVNSDTNNNEAPHEHKKKTPIWKIFSDFFGSSSGPNVAENTGSSTSTHQVRTMTTSQSTSQIHSSSSTAAAGAKKQGMKNLTTSFEQVVPHEQTSSSSDPTTAKSSMMIKPGQFDKKTLLARDEGRMQAYGWSLPSRNSFLTGDSKSASAAAAAVQSTPTTMTIPVPVYCRPLFEQDNELRLSCGSTVNLSVVADDKSLVEQSAYFSFQSPSAEPKSSCIWICNLNANDTHVCILDANRPGDLISQFTLKDMKVYCVASVAGAEHSEYPLSEEKLKSLSANLQDTNNRLMDSNMQQSPGKDVNDTLDDINYIEYDDEQQTSSSSTTATVTSGTADKPTGADPSLSAAGKSSSQQDEQKTLTSFYPTMWLGSQEGWLYVHSAVSNVSVTLEKVNLKDAILCITQNKGRVLVGLADGTVVMFHRNAEGLWDMTNYHVMNFGKPHHSIRTFSNVYETVWCGCRNKIFVLDPEDFKVTTTIEVHPRKENQVRHMAWSDHGVWVSIRLDSTLRLYHAKTYQLLQYLDIEPFITRMLGTSNLGLSLVRVSSLLIGSKRLWIGTGNGVILSLPINDTLKDDSSSVSKLAPISSIVPGTVIRVGAETSTPATSTSSSSKLVPYCNLSEAQFSFHGHRDAIKFFLNVPSQAIQKNPPTRQQASSANASYEKVEIQLVLSGGHGYIDFRIGDTKSQLTDEKLNEKKLSDIKTELVDSKSQMAKNERSHLIVWQINNSSPSASSSSSSSA